MSRKRPHYPDRKSVEYYYDGEAAVGGFEEHLRNCAVCNGRYLELQRSLDHIKEVFRAEGEAGRDAQSHRILAGIEELEKPAPVLPWRKLAPLTAAILITIGLLFSLNPKGDKPSADDYYVRLDRNDDLLIREMQNLMDLTLTESLGTINFWMDRVEQRDQSGSSGPRPPIRRVNDEAT